MLILTRRTNETLMIGDDVKITVLNVKGNQVRIGIEAPHNVAVHREEIYQRIQHEKQQGREDRFGMDAPKDAPVHREEIDEGFQHEQKGDKKVNKYKERYERAIKKPSLN